MIFDIASPFQQIISYSNCTDLSFPGTRVVAGWLSCHRDYIIHFGLIFYSDRAWQQYCYSRRRTGTVIVCRCKSRPRDSWHPPLPHARTHAGRHALGALACQDQPGYVCCMYVLELSGLPRPLSHAVGRSGHGRPVTHVTR